MLTTTPVDTDRTTRGRHRRDRCPGVLRPWPAQDGALVRVRLVGGHVAPDALAGLSAVAREHGDGDLHLTGRANLQLRALPSTGDGSLPEPVVAAVEATGLLPSRSHEMGRNVMVSPLTGLVGGRADLRGLARELDAGLQAEPSLAVLPGRFLLVLDDGRGDLLDRDADLGLVALDERRAQLRVGDAWGPVVALDEAASHLVALARRFVRLRGDGPTAAWHVEELDAPLVPAGPRDARLPADGPAGSRAAAYGPVPGAPGLDHVAAPDGVLSPALVDALVAAAAPGSDLVVTPWRGVLVTRQEAVR
ncbi:precorrin-3B synthase [Nocardioides scoriae]|uniref:Precorrin-3B synthase n=1 Tax=Nocardioides scoriae TaxID=642780 RepID=A0A1H1P0H0_9ACTN|nr:nitrite reductase [Nocardioides scoriae]SDS04525.1 precorrin-3B synthase [Nocardioides scoriae]